MVQLLYIFEQQQGPQTSRSPE